MTHLLDTDIIIGYLKGDRAIVEAVNKIPEACTTHINLAELFYGAYKSNNRRKHLQKLLEFMGGIELMNMNSSSSEIYGRMKNALCDKGKPPGDFDILIASVCLANNLTLITGNLKHYRNIPELRVQTVGRT